MLNGSFNAFKFVKYSSSLEEMVGRKTYSPVVAIDMSILQLLLLLIFFGLRNPRESRYWLSEFCLFDGLSWCRFVELAEIVVFDLCTPVFLLLLVVVVLLLLLVVDVVPMVLCLLDLLLLVSAAGLKNDDRAFLIVNEPLLCVIACLPSVYCVSAQYKLQYSSIAALQCI